MPDICPVCGSTKIRLFLDDEDRDLHPSLVGSSRQKVTHGRILRCLRCTFGFRRMRSDPVEMASLYRKMDVTIYEAELGGRLATAARHLSIVTRFVAKGRLLDVGCASGLFLQAARDAGWAVVGVEPSEALFAKAKAALGESTELHCTTLEHTKFATASFDAVTMWDVLEHVPDPLGFLQACASLLKPGAHLFVNVPDLDSFEA